MNQIRMCTYLAAVCAGGLISCGGGGGLPYAPPAATNQVVSSPVPSSPSPDLNVLNLYASAAVHASVAGSAFSATAFDSGATWLWRSGPCAAEEGSLQTTLDGESVVEAMALPSGSHTLVVAFSNCTVDALVGLAFDGTSSVAYTEDSAGFITEATFTTNSLRGHGSLVNWGTLYDVTADGSGAYSTVTTGTGYTSTYTPTRGSRLANNTTANVATFGGGSRSVSMMQSFPSDVPTYIEEFNNLVVTVSGASYILNGSLSRVYGSDVPNGLISAAGEVRVSSNGVLVARIYFTQHNALKVDVLAPIVPL